MSNRELNLSIGLGDVLYSLTMKSGIHEPVENVRHLRSIIDSEFPLAEWDQFHQDLREILEIVDSKNLKEVVKHYPTIEEMKISSANSNGVTKK